MADDTVREFLKKIGRKGGKARLKRHGVEALRVMGSKGGKARLRARRNVRAIAAVGKGG